MYLCSRYDNPLLKDYWSRYAIGNLAKPKKLYYEKHEQIIKADGVCYGR